MFRNHGYRQADEIVARTSCEACGARVLLTHGRHTLEADAIQLHDCPARRIPIPGIAHLGDAESF